MGPPGGCKQLLVSSLAKIIQAGCVQQQQQEKEDEEEEDKEEESHVFLICLFIYLTIAFLWAPGGLE